jgi:hypothetical protein
MASALLLSAGSDYNGDNSIFQREGGSAAESYTSRTIQVPFQKNQLTFGDLAYATLPKRDDIIKSITLKSTLGSLYPVTANGYVYPGSITDTNYYDSSGVLRLKANNVYGYFNTQLLNNWAQPFDSNVRVSVVNATFSFINVVGARFTTEESAAFWGFDIRYASSSNPWIFSSNVPQMNLVQSGWILGFLPPPVNFTYNDSVGYLLPRVSTLYVGGQTIQTINSQILYTETDLQIPLENQAALTILVGKNDSYSQSQPRNYWTTLTFDEIPISQLDQQDVQVSIQFENFNNLTSRTLLGGNLNGSAYTKYPITLVQQTVLKVFTYNGLIIVFGQYFDIFISVYNEATQALIQVITINIVSSAPCVAFDKFYYVSNGRYLVQYDLGSSGLSNPQTSTVDNYLAAGVFTSLAIGQYLFLMYDDSPVVYDTTLPLNSGSSYKRLSINLQNYITSIGGGTVLDIHANMSTATGTNIYYPVSTTIHTYIVYLNITKFLASNITAYNSIILPVISPGYSFTGDRSISDGQYIYYPFEFNSTYMQMYRLNSNTNILEVAPSFESVSDTQACPQIFDGIYMYYYDNETPLYTTYRFYNTTMKFTDPNAWSYLRVNNDGSTISTNGTTYPAYSPGGSGYMILGSQYNYNFLSTGNIVKIDPYVIVPSLSASLIVEYSKLLQPEVSSQSLIKQTQMNTFTMRAGTTNNQFIFTFTGPVREFWFKTAASIARITIELNGVILADEDYNSINILRPFERHVITTYQTTGIYSIALDPNKIEPSGTLNISRIRSATMTIYFATPYTTDQTIYVFARSLNVLQCEDGIGGLLFN